MNYGGIGGVANDPVIFTKELKAMINNLKNVPSIVTWVVFNEAGGQHDTKKYVELVRSLDSTRFINEASGWTHYGNGDIKDIHPYPAPSYTTSATQATACGEYGGVKFAVNDHLWNGNGWGYASVADATEYDDTYTEYANKLAIYKNTKGLSAAVYTQLTDVEIEVNGLMTYDRLIKSDINRIRKANRIIIEGVGTEPDYILSTADSKPESWKYTTTEPATGWTEENFDDADWKTGDSGFGKGMANVKTSWTTSDIWLRKNLTLNITKDDLASLKGRIFYDEDVDLYINGVPAFNATGYLTTYKTITFSQDALNAINLTGDNQIAMHVKQTAGNQYIDFGMFLSNIKQEEPKTHEIQIKLDYTKSSEISVRIGYSLDPDATEPEISYDYTRLPLEESTIGLNNDLLLQPTDLRYNITTLTRDLDPTSIAKFFVYVNTTEGDGEGTAYECKLIDYTNNPDGDATDLMSSNKELVPASSILLTGVINKPTGINENEALGETNISTNVYTIDGKMLKRNVSSKKAVNEVQKGLYIIGKKVYKK